MQNILLKNQYVCRKDSLDIEHKSFHKMEAINIIRSRLTKLVLIKFFLKYKTIGRMNHIEVYTYDIDLDDDDEEDYIWDS